MKNLYLTLAVLLIGCQFAIAQNRQIKGKVTDSSGLPMPGVTVMATRVIATTTNIEGAFRLDVPNDVKELTFTFIGMKNLRVPVSNDMQVKMQEDVKQLDEVMVTAYGTSKKSSYTGSAAVVKSDKLEKIQTANVTQALQGMASGVQVINNNGAPGSDAKIIIRGIGSMNASSDPLYVVDGVAFSGYLNSINSSDIESMTVLKDASATALYGSRAANGVIMITTKKGKNEKGSVNFKATFGFSDLAVTLPERMNPQDFYELNWEAIRNGKMDGGMTAENAAMEASNTVVSQLKVNPFSVDKPIGVDGKLLPDAQLLYQGDWSDELLKSRMRQDYTIDFSGQTGKVNYFISGGYLNDKGVFSTQKYERFSGRANINSQVKEWLEVGLNTSLSHSIQYSPEPSVSLLRSMPSIYPVYEWDDATEDYRLDNNGNKIYDYGSNRVAWIGLNPLADKAYNNTHYENDNVSARAYVGIKFTDYLSFKTNFSVDYVTANAHSYINSTYGFAAGKGGIGYKNNDRTMAYTVNNILTFDKTFGSHHVNVLIGQEAHKWRYNNLMAEREGFPFMGLEELASAATMTGSNSYVDNYRLLSWLGKVDYDFADKYYISGSFRTDGSSRFHPDNRWGKFWSVGASWRMSNEAFLKDITWLDNLKLKASYGGVGNDQINLYAYQGLYMTGLDDYSYPGVFISRLPNTGLKWESNMQFNVGADIRVFDRLELSFEWFKRKSKDLLFPQPMAPSTGIASIDRNIGNVQNTGFEIQFNATAINMKNFRWSIDLNATHYKNKITKLPQKAMNQGYFKWQEGESRYNFWGPEWAGVNPETGNGQWWKNIYEVNTAGEQIVKERIKTENFSDVSGDDQKKYLGDAIPKLFGGFTNTFYSYGVDLSIFLYYSIGGKLYDDDYSSMMGQRWGHSYHKDMQNRWTPENKNSDIPRLSTAYSNSLNTYSSRFLYNNSFLRLRNVSLGYTFPKAMTENVGISTLRLFVQGDNLLTFGKAKRRGTDPEQSFSGTTNNRFPTVKTVSFGVQVSL